MSRLDELTAAIRERAQELYSAAQDAAGDRRTTLFADSSLLFEAVAALAELSALAEQLERELRDTMGKLSDATTATICAVDDADEARALAEQQQGQAEALREIEELCHQASLGTEFNPTVVGQIQKIVLANMAWPSAVSGAGSTAGGVRLDADAIAEEFNEVSWQISPLAGGMPTWSRRHLWREGDDAALCGAKINWHRGNWSHNNSGPCKRCRKIASAVSGAGTQPTPEPEEKP